MQLGYREVLKKFDNALLPGSVDNPEDDDVDMTAPVTPPADTPSSPRPKVRTASRAVSHGRGRALSRHGSGVLSEATPLKDNPFTTVPPSFNPQQSPTRKGKKREREPAKVSEKVEEPSESKSNKRTAEKEAEACSPGYRQLELGLDDGEKSTRRSPPRKKAKS